MGYDSGREDNIRVNQRPHIARYRWAAALIALAALFHVQWVAACDLASSAAAGPCCPQPHAGASDRCQGDADARDCLVPFAKNASGVKVPERVPVLDDAPDEVPVATLFDPAPRVTVRVRPPGKFQDAVWPDGGRIYLTSGRLRL